MENRKEKMEKSEQVLGKEWLGHGAELYATVEGRMGASEKG
jgi:hypothetical protein